MASHEKIDGTNQWGNPLSHHHHDQHPFRPFNIDTLMSAGHSSFAKAFDDISPIQVGLVQ